MQPLIQQTKKRGPNKEWTTLVVCKYKEDADEWLAENECFWIYHYSHNIMKYADQVYCCDHSSKNRPGHFQCKANMRIRYRKDLSALSVAFIQTTREPDH